MCPWRSSARVPASAGLRAPSRSCVTARSQRMTCVADHFLTDDLHFLLLPPAL